MRSTRMNAALAISVVLVSACSSSKQAVTTPSSTPVVSSSAVVSSSTPQSPTITTPVLTTNAKPAVDPLTGGKVSSNPVIATKIDNTYFQTPQFGVADADVVFVEQVEGGLTRLIAVFHTTLPTEVGPVRSVRSTDAQLLPAFGTPGLVFSGGAGGPLADLAKTSIVDTSGLAQDYFRSDAASGTYNLHANLMKIATDAKGLGPVRSIGFNFVAKSPEIQAGKAITSIKVVMEQGETDFSYTAGRYVRMRNGAQVSDYQGKVEAADNVVVMNVTDTPDGTVDTNGQPSYLSRTVGHGQLTIFRDGRQMVGTWKRASATSPFTFLDSEGRPLPFKPGKTWIMLAPRTVQLTAH